MVDFGRICPLFGMKDDDHVKRWFYMDLGIQGFKNLGFRGLLII